MAEETAPLNLPASGPLERFLKAVSDAISEGFKQMGGLTPLVFAVMEKGNGYVIGVPSRLGAGNPDKTDERVAKWMRNHFRKHDVIRYAEAYRLDRAARSKLSRDDTPFANELAALVDRYVAGESFDKLVLALDVESSRLDRAGPLVPRSDWRRPDYARLKDAG